MIYVYYKCAEYLFEHVKNNCWSPTCVRMSHLQSFVHCFKHLSRTRFMNDLIDKAMPRWQLKVTMNLEPVIFLIRKLLF